VFVVVISNEQEMTNCPTQRSLEQNSKTNDSSSSYHPTIQRMQRAKEYSDSLRLQRLQQVRTSHPDSLKEAPSDPPPATETSLNDTASSSQKPHFTSLRQLHQDHSRQSKAKPSARSLSSQKVPVLNQEEAKSTTQREVQVAVVHQSSK